MRAIDVLAAAVAVALFPLAGLAAQERPPAPGPLRPVQFPPFHERRLASGLDLVVIEHHEQPVVTATLSFPAGSAYDPPGREGLASLTAEVLTKGTRARSAEQIAAAIEGVGGELAASAGPDFLQLSTSVLSEHADLAFELLGDILQAATFPEAELELARTRYLSQLELELSQPEAVADRFFVREIYGAHPYGRRPTPASYKAITREDVRRFAAERLRPRGALLVVAGDVTPRQVEGLLARHLGAWRGAVAAAPPWPRPPAPRATDILLVHRPGSAQANIVLGNTTMPPGDPNFYALRLVTHLLGGGADSRLFLILREQKGWTYGAYAQDHRYRGLGCWQATAETRTEVADSALGELLRQVDRVRTETVPDSELANTKGFLVGSFPLSIETPNQIARQVTTAKLLGLGNDYLSRYRERLAAVTGEAARAAARTYYRRDALAIVVVGDATKLHQRLRAIAPVRLVDLEGKPLTVEDLAPKAGPLPLDRAQLVARTDSFRILLQGNPFGTQVRTLRATPDSLIYTEVVQLGPTGQQTTTVVFGASDLSVRQVDQTLAFGPQRGETHLRYAGSRVQGTATVPQPGGAPRSVSVDTALAAGTLDENAVGVIVPALPLQEGAGFVVNAFTAGEAAVRVLSLKVNAPEAVTVPAGTFQAYRVDITGGRTPIQMFVTTEAPRRVIKVVPLGTPLAVELLP
ncbi:MAG TPA: pitrilysin family protein [Gemmatimonadales bacterium]|nr:pitrilysin family protein [Gemmatimonadales bacterium]